MFAKHFPALDTNYPYYSLNPDQVRCELKSQTIQGDSLFFDISISYRWKNAISSVFFGPPLPLYKGELTIPRADLAPGYKVVSGEIQKNYRFAAKIYSTSIVRTDSLDPSTLARVLRKAYLINIKALNDARSRSQAAQNAAAAKEALPKQ